MGEVNPKIKSIIANYDFEKVHQVMTHLNWGWYDHETDTLKVPKISELVLKAQDMLEQALREKTSIATGGFWALYREYHPEEIEDFCNDDNYTLQLLFVIEEGYV